MSGETKERPLVAVGVIVLKEGKILMGERIASHGAGTWQIPGGHMEFGKTFEETARDEVREETGLTDIEFERIVCLSNQILYGKHYVDIGFLTKWRSGEPFAAEPEKSRNWQWVDPEKLPQPLFPPSKAVIDAWLTKEFFNEIKI